MFETPTQVIWLAHVWFHARWLGLTVDQWGWVAVWFAVVLPAGETRFSVRAWQAATLLSVYGVITALLRLTAAAPTADAVRLLTALWHTPGMPIWVGLLVGRGVWFLGYWLSLWGQAHQQAILWRMDRVIKALRAGHADSHE